jgi:hypothetical protein
MNGHKDKFYLYVRLLTIKKIGLCKKQVHFNITVLPSSALAKCMPANIKEELLL